MKLWGQIAIGVGLAASLVGGLQWWVSRAGAAQEDAATPTALAAAAVEPPPDPGPEGRRLLGNLQGEAASFHLAPARADLPPGCAPILTVVADGRIEVTEAAPLPTRPGPLRWPALGIVLPARSLDALSPAARASLVAIWTELSGADVPARGDVFLHACSARPGELERLLRWTR